MSKFHLGANGPAQCKATKRACPLGGDEIHFDSLAAAAVAYHEKMSGIPAPLKARSVRPIEGKLLGTEVEYMRDEGDSYQWGVDWNGLSDTLAMTAEAFSDSERKRTGLALAQTFFDSIKDDYLAQPWGNFETYYEEPEMFEKTLSDGSKLYAIREPSQTKSGYYTVFTENTTFANVYTDWAMMSPDDDDVENDDLQHLTATSSQVARPIDRIMDAEAWQTVDVKS